MKFLKIFWKIVAGNWKRKIVSGVIVVLFLLVVVLPGFILEWTVPAIGSKATGTTVTLKGASFNLFAGTLTLDGLSVGNPAGYLQTNALSIKRFYINLGMTSLLSKKVIIQEVLIDGMTVDFEWKLTESNLTQIKNHILPPAEETAAAQPVDPENTAKKDDRKMVIQRLLMRNCSVSVSSSAMATYVQIPMVDVDMTDVGDGRPYSERFAVLWDAMVEAVTRAVTDSNIAESAKSAAKRAVEQIGKTAEGLTPEVNRAAGELKKLLNFK